MQKILAFIAFSMILSSPALAADSYTIDPVHTYPSFEVRHLGFSTQRGRFDKNSGKITIDAAAKTGSVELIIDVASLSTVYQKLTDHLLADDFFNVEKFKTMSFKSNKLIFEGDKIVAAEGTFTLLGVSKPLRLTVSNFRCGQHPMNQKSMCGADVTATIKRSDFGMSKLLPAIGDEVGINAPVEAYKD